ncbi:MAG: biopolymer transporter ExbD [Lentisphaeria bacterium]|nr:biopolymer transporter ExbD [Lentisphaeria bacterium]
MRRRRERDGRRAAIDEINVTPLLDLTFLLLIAFMITMPLMEYGTKVSPPEMNSNDLPENNFKSISLTGKGTVLLGDTPVSKDELLIKLRELKLSNPKLQLLLRADGSCSYKDVIGLMAKIRNGGFSDITLVTQGESSR